MRADGIKLENYWITTLVDVDDLFKARDEVNRSHTRFTALLDSANVVLLSVDAEQRITFCKGPLPKCDSCELTCETAHRQELKRVYPDDVLARACQRVLDGESDIIDVQSLVCGATIDFHLTRVNKTDEVGDGVIIVARDVTERVQEQAELQKAQDECVSLVAAERAATEASRLKTAFLANMSHELRTPLSVVQGIGELLLSQGLKSAEQGELVENSVRACSLLLEIINTVL